MLYSTAHTGLGASAMEPCSFVLLSTESILEQILGNLSLKDLVCVQLVCKCWQAVSKRVIQQQQREKGTRVDVLTSGRVSEEKSDKFFEEELEDWKKTWMFIQDVILANITLLSPHVMSKPQLKSGSLPNQCKVVVFETQRGVVCSDNQKAELEDEPHIDCLTTMCNLLSFSKPSIYFSTLPAGRSKDEKEAFLSSVANKVKDPDVKFLLIFSLDEDLAPETIIQRKIGDELKKAAAKGVVIAGNRFETPIFFYSGESSSSSHQELDLQPQDYVAVFFEGKNVQSCSVRIDPEIDSVTKLDRELKSLKKAADKFFPSCQNHFEHCNSKGWCDRCNSQTVGFMFAEYVRGDAFDWYEEDGGPSRPPRYNLEQDAFRLIFSKTPLFGGYCEAVMGETINVGRRRAADDLDLSFDSSITLFSILTFKSP